MSPLYSFKSHTIKKKKFRKFPSIKKSKSIINQIETFKPTLIFQTIDINHKAKVGFKKWREIIRGQKLIHNTYIKL